MPDRNPTLDRTPFSYQHFFWGERIQGSKQDLQSLGLGVGLPYPGEPSGPKRAMTVIDPRGLPAKIERGRYEGDAPFVAKITFPGRSFRSLEKWALHAPGVRSSTYGPREHYVGTAEHLVAAGIVPVGCFPGHPGMRKTRVRLYADGSVVSGPLQGNDRRTNECGAKSIARRSKSTYSVHVVVSGAAAMQRQRAFLAAAADFQHKLSALPRPQPLQPGGRPVPTNAGAAEDRVGDFVEECEDLLDDTVETILETLSGKDCGVHYYDQKTRAKIAAALEHARQLLQTATPSTRRAPSPRAAQLARPMNAEFQAFMAAALKKPGKGRRHG